MFAGTHGSVHHAPKGVHKGSTIRVTVRVLYNVGSFHGTSTSPATIENLGL